MSEIEKFLFNTSFDEAALSQDKASAEAVEEEAAGATGAAGRRG